MNVIYRISKLIKSKKYIARYIGNNTNKLKPPWNILFFGTDEFSIASLKALCKEYRTGTLLNNLEVVTSQKAKANSVEKFALEEQLVLHNWPVDQVQCNRFHLGIVVSFGYLIPENIINNFCFGMLNVHASLLPRWRGAAPIIYAIANGDKETGITVMKISPNKFDVGDIISQATVKILPNARLPDLLSTLADLGAKELIHTLKELTSNLKSAVPQPKEGVTHAPKITSQIAVVSWNDLSACAVINLDRALTGIYPLRTSFNDVPIKLYNISETYKVSKDVTPGLIRYCKHSKALEIQCADGSYINVKHVSVAGRKMMSARDFDNGFLSKQLEHLRICR